MPRRRPGPIGALLVVAAVGAAVRAAPILAHGRFGSRPDYDDGVNFAAAALLTGGVLPYRDFFYAHPPGGPLVLSPFAALAHAIDPGRAFAVAGLAVVAISALTTFLLGRLSWRTWGPAAGLVAAGVYAVHPEVVVAERTTFMEPVLNLACIAMATAWLGEATPSRRRALLAGVLAGAAVTLKLWALPWVVAALVSAPREDRRATLARFLAGAAATVAAVTLPFALPALGAFLDGTLLFHLWRPADGTLSASGRIHEILGFVPDSWRVVDGRHAATGVLAVGGMVLAALRGRRSDRRAERFFPTAFLLVGLMFLTGRSYFTHYNAHLALAESALAGLLSGAVWTAMGRVRPVAARRIALAGLAVLLLLPPWLSFQEVRKDARMRSPDLVALGSALRGLPQDACLFPFEPTWAFAGGRLPSVPEGGPVVLDPYGVMIFDAVREGARFDDLASLFADERSQGTVRDTMAACRLVVLGGRGEAQLSEASKAWLRRNFARLDVGAPVDVWERLPVRPDP